MGDYWTAFYWKEYIGKTRSLSPLEHGVYFLLMCHYYTTREPLPANVDELQRICSTFDQREIAALNKVLKKFFILDGDVYRHNRIEEELQKSRQLSEKRSVAANKAVEARRAIARANGQQVVEQTLDGTLTQSQSQSHKEQIHSAVEQVYKQTSTNCSPTDTTDPDTPSAIASWIGKETGLNGDLNMRILTDAITAGVQESGKLSMEVGEIARDAWIKYAVSEEGKSKFAKQPGTFFGNLRNWMKAPKPSKREFPLQGWEENLCREHGIEYKGRPLAEVRAKLREIPA